MSNKPARLFYMPYHFEIVRDDTASLSDKQFRLYHLVLERYWLRDCNIEITTLAKACQCTDKVLRALIDEVPSFDDIDGMLVKWSELTIMLNALNRSMGLEDAYPFVLSELTLKKLRFVHGLIYPVHGLTYPN